MAEQTKPKRRGRPTGSANVATVVTVQASRCPNCQSTRRAEYGGRQVQEFAGVLSDGTPYTHIVRRRTRCLDCDQHRIDKTFENHPTENKSTSD